MNYDDAHDPTKLTIKQVAEAAEVITGHLVPLGPGLFDGAQAVADVHGRQTGERVTVTGLRLTVVLEHESGEECEFEAELVPVIVSGLKQPGLKTTRVDGPVI